MENKVEENIMETVTFFHVVCLQEGSLPYHEGKTLQGSEHYQNQITIKRLKKN